MSSTCASEVLQVQDLFTPPPASDSTYHKIVLPELTGVKLGEEEFEKGYDDGDIGMG